MHRWGKSGSGPTKYLWWLIPPHWFHWIKPYCCLQNTEETWSRAERCTKHLLRNNVRPLWVNIPVMLTFLIYFVLKFSLESLLSSTAVFTGYYFEGKQTSSLKTTGMLVNLTQIVGAKPRYPDYLPPGYRHEPARREFCYNKLENINLPHPHIKIARSTSTNNLPWGASLRSSHHRPIASSSQNWWHREFMVVK
jgi:hypothetical protein